ncbi:potassium channel family protein [Paenibacillus whitsoniae]|uniref:Potassium channel protein n=1 Tax=Paenibacillus whitsoniae TaxID=2496558 RepID=A0A3S0A7Q8_9BACL|nr:potassium channel family protein [Paenibacillus whitsoniae]RTE11622.1 potassium channel protein [Paenibacillus whitsoniae]
MLFFAKFLRRLIHLNNWLVVLCAALFIVFSALLAYAMEPDTFETRFNGFWWVMTTVTTVGYGDFYPHTVAGKCLGIVVYMFGIGIISITISKVVDALFVYQRRREEGKLKYSGEGHFVLIDWTQHADNAMKEILQTDPQAEIVLIDMMERSPIRHERVHYIQGNPQHVETLEMANTGQAKAVFIFADEVTMYQNTVRDPSYVDGRTLLVAATVERNYSHVYTVVEVRDKRNLPNFEHIHVDEFIFGSETISQLAVRAAFNPGSSRIVSQLLTRTPDGEDLYEIPKQSEWVTFEEAFHALLRQGATLIAEGDRLDINKRLKETIPPDARLFVICDYETYVRIGQSIVS